MERPIWSRDRHPLIPFIGLFFFLLAAGTCMYVFVPDAKQYFVALLDHVFTLGAGCVATVMLGIIQKYVLRKPLTPRWEIAIFLCFVFFAGFQAWHDEYKEHVSAEQAKATSDRKLDDLTKPSLQPQMLRLFFAPSGEHGEDCLVTMIAAVVNRGAPSIATVSLIKVVSRDGKDFIVQTLPPTKQVELHTGGPSSPAQIYTDFLPRKLTSQPIPLNGQADGYMQFVVHGVSREEMRTPGTLFQLSVEDINKKTYTTQYRFSSSDETTLPDIKLLEKESGAKQQ